MKLIWALRILALDAKILALQFRRKDIHWFKQLHMANITCIEMISENEGRQ